MSRRNPKSKIGYGSKYKRTIFLLLVVIVCLSVVKVYAANRLVQKGKLLAEIDSSISKLEFENQTLENETAFFSSLAVLEKKAKEFGLERHNRAVIYLERPKYAYTRF